MGKTGKKQNNRKKRKFYRPFPDGPLLERERKVKDRKQKEEIRGGTKGYKEPIETADRPDILPYLNQIYCGDSEKILTNFPDSFVDIIITSPPYNFGQDYKGKHEKVINDAVKWENYFDKLNRIWKQCVRILKPGGRLCVNIQPVFSDYIPTHHIISNQLQKLNLLWKSEILWEKHHYNCKYTAWGCYSDKVRVLTNNGLKYFRETDINVDKFATMNMNSGRLEYQKAFDYVEKDYDGNLINIKTHTFDLSVTEHHNMLYQVGKSRYIGDISDLMKKRNAIIIPTKHHGWNGGVSKKSFILPNIKILKHTSKKYYKDFTKKIEIDMDDWLRFLGIFITAGYYVYCPQRGCYKVSIYHRKKKFLDEIINLLERLPFDFRYNKQKDEYYTNNKHLAKYLKKNTKNTIPQFIQELSNRQIFIFLDWFCKGDGEFKNGQWHRINTPSENILNQLLNLLIKINCHFSISKEEQKPRLYKGKLIKSKKPMYRITIKQSKTVWLEKRRPPFQKTKYKGKVYCVSVPNQTLLVEKSGKFCWCGNSWKSPSMPYLKYTWEFIEVFSKNTHKKIGDRSKIDISGDEFKKWVYAKWDIAPETRMKQFGHPAMFPEEIPRRLLKLFSYVDDVVLDPFVGIGTTALVAEQLNRRWIGIDISRKYCNSAKRRIKRYRDSKG